MTPTAAALALANLIAACILLIFGRRPERIAVVIVILFLGATEVADQLTVDRVRYAVAGLDLALFLSFWALARYGDRWWLIDAAALQLLTVTTHVVPLISDHYLWAQVTSRYLIWTLISVLFFIGAWEARGAQVDDLRRAAA